MLVIIITMCYIITTGNKEPKTKNHITREGKTMTVLEALQAAKNCWIAKIGFRNRTITIGRFQKIEDAIKARQLAEEEYFEPVLKKNV